MKFGVVIHKPTMNLGDDIQTYAAAKLLPHVDYQIDREYISDFKSENDEPVAVIMNAWWMWKKWNWPPADCIIPKLLSMHINNYGVARKSSPIYAEWAQGCGGEFFKKYGPVGCRDMASLDFFKEQGIDCYFSGCLTLTIPKQEKTEDAGTYVCLVDLNDKIRAKAMEYLKDTGLETKVKLEIKQDVLNIYNIKEQIEKANNRKIWLKCGGFITIDKTEALTAIDVNSGKYIGSKDLDQTIYTVNKEATIEIAKQLRLRDIGGIIIIDYIDMENQETKQKILKVLEESVKKDRSKIQIVGFTPLDLLEMTRKHICSND